MNQKTCRPNARRFFSHYDTRTGRITIDEASLAENFNFRAHGHSIRAFMEKYRQEQCFRGIIREGNVSCFAAVFAPTFKKQETIYHITILNPK